jgi:hypothetical protein
VRTKYYSEKLKGRYRLGDQDVDGKTVLMELKQGVCLDWIYLAQNEDQWRALVNTVMNLRLP